MHNREKKKILAVVDDLLFTVKISDAAKRVGLDVEFLKSAHDVVEKATHEKPLLIILDLNNNSVEPLPLISKLKDDGALKNISIIGGFGLLYLTGAGKYSVDRKVGLG